MASPLQRPLFKAVGLSPTRSRRCFSQFRPLQARDSTNGTQQFTRPPRQAEKSFKVMQKEMAQIPHDVGLLESTFIAPRRDSFPSFFSSPRVVLRFRWKHLLFRLRDLVSLFVLKYSSPPQEGHKYRRSMKISRSTITPTAVALHRQMYTSFAEGDAAALSKICLDGLYETFRARIAARRTGEKMEWEMLGYNARSKLVSHRAARLQVEGAAVRQAVVRIASKQKLTRWARNGKELKLVKGSGKEKDVVEYLVLQKRMDGWKEGDWVVWGTTEETKLKDVMQWERKLLE